MIFPILQHRAALVLALLGSVVLLLAIAGCGGTEMRPVPVIPGGGGGSAPSAPAVPAQPAVPAATQKMLQDPEGDLEDNAIVIYANSQAEAERKCQEVAKNYTNSTGVVQCIGCVKSTKTTGQYVCTIGIEALPAKSTEQPQ